MREREREREKETNVCVCVQYINLGKASSTLQEMSIPMQMKLKMAMHFLQTNIFFKARKPTHFPLFCIYVAPLFYYLQQVISCNSLSLFKYEKL